MAAPFDWDKAAAELRRPFTAAAIKMKPQSVTKDQSKGLVSYYIDARLAAERLSAAVGPDGWGEEYHVIAADPRFGLPIECRLTVAGITRADVGQIAPGDMDDKAWKSAYSDALKRAAVKFGVGAYLYNSPNNWVETRVGGNGKAQGFSENGIRTAREHYAKWIASKPVKDLYGLPLDHGDIEPPAEPELETGEPLASPVDQKKLDRLITNLASLDDTKDWASIADKYALREFGHGRDKLTETEIRKTVEALNGHIDALDKARIALGVAS